MQVPGPLSSRPVVSPFLLTIILTFTLAGWAQQGTVNEQQANSVNLGERQAAERTKSSASALPGLSEGGMDAPPNLPDLDISQRARPLVTPLIPGMAAPASPPQPVVPKTTRKIQSKYDINKIGDRKIGKGLDFFSLDKEAELGRSLAEEVESGARLVRDPIVNEYINRVGQNLVRNSDARVPFVIKVVDNEEINAFALPGGFFYVNTGLILAADNEAELAGVMAHEIAHVAARHATKNATRSQIFNLASIPLVFLGGPVGYAVRQAVGLAMPMSMLKFSRDAEREADMLGLEYQYASGYDPEEFIKFFEKLRVQETKKQSFFAKAFATHPMTQDRIKRAQDEISQYLPAREDYIIDTSDFQEVKRQVQRLTDSHRIDMGKVATPTLRKRGAEKEEGPPKLERK